MGKKEEIAAVITPALTSLGFYLEDLNITSAGRRSLLTVIVDGDKHLSLDEVTVATKAISEIVENIPSLGSTPFTLEVTSPGIDRLVKVITIDGSQILGRIISASEDSATVDEHNIKYLDIKRATLEVEFKSGKK